MSATIHERCDLAVVFTNPPFEERSKRGEFDTQTPCHPRFARTARIRAKIAGANVAGPPQGASGLKRRGRPESVPDRPRAASDQSLVTLCVLLPLLVQVTWAPGTTVTEGVPNTLSAMPIDAEAAPPASTTTVAVIEPWNRQ